ncbi:hypothetical protein [Curvivirga sp.]|uniref:hypothetical protein n=1 Tax=Curvivirga sp. TaxID=2856848 RepID=UPI003B5CD9FB
MKFFTRITTMLMVALFVVACVKPIYNVHNHPISSEAQKNLSLDEIGNVILKSALDRGWEVNRVSDNEITVRYARRDFVASAKVNFSITDYSIQYDSSSNLNYKNGQIHRNYNNWIINLENDIARNLDKLAYNLD